MVAELQLGALPKGDPRAPGPTAFQDIDHVAGLTSEAGLSNIGANAVEIMLSPPDSVSGAARAASRADPAARIMKTYKGGPVDEQAIETAVLEAFMQFDQDGEVRIPTVVNLFTAST